MSQFSLLRLRRFHQIKFAPLSFSPSTTQFSHWMCDITDMYGTTCFYPGQALTSVSINIIPLRTSGFFWFARRRHRCKNSTSSTSRSTRPSSWKSTLLCPGARPWKRPEECRMLSTTFIRLVKDIQPQINLAVQVITACNENP